MQHNKSSNDIGRHIALILAAASLTACGSESTAASTETQGNVTTHAAASAQPKAASQAAPAAVALPIAQGVYAEASQGCTRATRIFFYDNSHYGDIYQAQPEIRGYQSAVPAYSEIHRIVRVGPSARNSYEYEDFRGFTRIWAADNQVEMQGIQSTGQGRFIRRRGEIPTAGANGGRFFGADDTYQLCTFAQLSPQMQATIRAERPQLAGGRATTRSAGASASIPVPVAPFNIRPGHYVPVAASCGTTSDMVFYYDGRRAGWIDLSPFAANRMEPVASARRRGADWVVDAVTGETLQVQAADKITVGDPNTGVETMRWCPAAEVRASARAQ